MKETRRCFPVTLESWGWSRQGHVRADNQDSFVNWAEHLLWAVADGVGGSEYGGMASKAIARVLLDIPRPQSLDAHVANVTGRLSRTNVALYRQGQATGNLALSTVVTLLIHGSEASCLWAGDSRCYIFRNGVLYQCTHDHTLRQEKIDRGELTAPEARRMVRGNIITNAIGATPALRLDQARFTLRAGDRFLLCSDGLFNLLSPGALSISLMKATAKESVEHIAAMLDDLPQNDNITFIAVFLSNLD
ncbi:MAG: protein phosphatase 2C domain-containing protein [Proteobacteria bacterium]|nr:protein phosphatase 2C domain-containing protein [Pseudomonadota bacterium]